VCLAFVHLSAPDLALTQLLVEMASIVLMMLALAWLPAESPPERARWTPHLHAAIALAAGLGSAALVWLVLGRPFESISPFFLENALPLGGGGNVVNVIIVDFRGFDTLGEITVMGIAALIVHALLAGLMPAPGRFAGGGIGLSSVPAPLMLQLVARGVLPLAVLISLYLYLRGHNLPGGGFIAGLVLALGLMLQVVAHGLAWVDARARLDHGIWIGAGLLIAAATGVAAWAFGAPLLTSTYDYPWLPGVGGVPLASASAFDLGVYLVVTSATLVMLLSIARVGRAGWEAAPAVATPRQEPAR
jgi:multicomponent K+:H+ antiporter subunit A